METPLIAGFVKKKHEAKTWAWSGKTTEGQASPNDFHIRVVITLDKDFL